MKFLIDKTSLLEKQKLHEIFHHHHHNNNNNNNNKINKIHELTNI